ncbi:MAG: hypothetical protein P4M11_08580 [Candidatus Pacebacteria bacterium]|nr:hypothetical protein [Candidatus Paceibacterota bacterium]
MQRGASGDGFAHPVVAKITQSASGPDLQEHGPTKATVKNVAKTLFEAAAHE